MRILFYYIHNLCPPRSGSHKRALWCVRQLVEAGHEVHFASSSVHSEVPWTTASEEMLLQMGVRSVHIHRPSRVEKWMARVRRKLGITAKLPPLEDYDWVQISPGHRAWFHRLKNRLQPDCLFINYAWFAKFLDTADYQKYETIMETQDVLGINQSHRKHVEDMLRQVRVGIVPPGAFAIDLMQRLPEPECAAEMAVYARFDKVIAISDAEEQVLVARIDKEKIYKIPNQEGAVTLDNRYNGKILVTAGPNPFNELGLRMFFTQVWPRVRELCPEVQLVVTGMKREFESMQIEGVEFAGFVDDLDTLYAAAPFTVSPVYVGTGQQVKVVESLARAVPVVAFDVSTVSPMLAQGVTGFRVSDAESMAQAIAKLWQDRELCRQLGRAGQAVVAKDAARCSIKDLWEPKIEQGGMP